MFNTDLHIHSCVSPCADMNMTPEAVVETAVAAGLDLIALTDHNTCKNCAAAAAAAEKQGIGFIPGIEVTTLEDIHCVCLFPDLGKAASFSRWLDTLLPPLPRRSSPQGRLLNPTVASLRRQQEERQLLYLARQISVLDLHETARRYHGLCWPAHVSKPYNSLYAVLGTWPAELRADAAELYLDDLRPEGIPRGVKTLRVSNARHLWDIRKGGFPLPLDTPSFEGLRRYLLGE